MEEVQVTETGFTGGATHTLTAEATEVTIATNDLVQQLVEDHQMMQAHIESLMRMVENAHS